MGDNAEEATRSLNRRRGKGKGKGKKGKGKRGKGKGKGDDCPSVQDIETFIEEEMEGRNVTFLIYKRPQTRRPLCPLHDGLDQRRRRVQRRDFRNWRDEPATKVRPVIRWTSIVISSSVAETITEESIGTCAAKMMEEWGEDSMMDK